MPIYPINQHIWWYLPLILKDVSPGVVVDGVGRLSDVKLGRPAPGGAHQGEEEGGAGAGKLASLEPTAPRCISVASKQTSTGSLQGYQHCDIRGFSSQAK